MTYDELMQNILTAKEQMLHHSIEANSVTLNGRKYGKLIENLLPNMKPTVFGMAVKADYALPDDYDFLVQYEPPKPITNADRIRAMSDEELAVFLYGLVNEFGSMNHDCLDFNYCKIHSKEYRYDGWLDWLRQEAWNQIQFREARFLYDTEEDIQRLTGDRMIPKDGQILE